MDVRTELAPTGVLRASINLGNPVLAHGSPAAPGGVTVDIANALGVRLGVPVEFLCFDAARESFEAMTDGRCDVCFLAVDPAREGAVAFSAPYVLIEGVFAVPAGSDMQVAGDVDRDGVRVGVKRGSAYDLYLSRTLERAQVVRGEDGVVVFREQRLEVAAGIRRPIEEHVRDHGDMRLLEPAFMVIRQAVGISRTKSDDAIGFVWAFVEELKSTGFIADALRHAGRTDAAVAPPAA